MGNDSFLSEIDDMFCKKTRKPLGRVKFELTVIEDGNREKCKGNSPDAIRNFLKKYE
jgi:hypothetical protein